VNLKINSILESVTDCIFVRWLEECGLPCLHLAISEKSLVDRHDDPGSILLACPKHEVQIIAIDGCILS
jgi:hypothetical protein